MQSVNKYSGKNHIGLGWIVAGAVLAIVVAAIGLLLALNSYRLRTPAPAVSMSVAQPAASAHAQTLADITSSGHYPFGASGFDSLLPSKLDTTPAELIGSGHYPFGATGFDSLLSSKPATTPAGVNGATSRVFQDEMLGADQANLLSISLPGGVVLESQQDDPGKSGPR